MYDEKFERDEFVLNSATSNGSSHSDISDDVVIKQYYKSQRRFSDKEIESMRKSFETVVVNDFSDEYHLSDDERYENAEIAKLSKSIAKTKRRCNNLYDYVMAMRLRMEAINYIAKTNMVYSPDKFVKKVLKGDIILNGLSFPKYTGKNKKGINWEYIAEFILDESRDAIELKRSKYRPIDIDEIEDIDEFRKEMFPAELYHQIIENPVDPDDPNAPTIDIPELSGKKLRKLYGDDIYRNLFTGSKTFKDKMTTAKTLSYAFDRISEIDNVTEYDTRRRLKNKAVKMPEFEGDISNKDDVQAWLYKCKEWEDNNVLVPTGNGRMTQSQIDELELRESLEKMGWNVRKFDLNNEKHKKKGSARRRDKKRTNSVADNIRDASERKKKKKKKHRLDRERDGCVESAHKAIDDMLVGISGGDYEDFEKYEKEMKTCSYESVFGKDE